MAPALRRNDELGFGHGRRVKEKRPEITVAEQTKTNKKNPKNKGINCWTTAAYNIL